MVIQKQKAGTPSKPRVSLVQYVSPSLAAKLGLIVTLVGLSIILFLVGEIFLFAVNRGIGVILMITAAFLLSLSALLQIGAWILFGRKLDQIEASVSANAGYLQGLSGGVAQTNETLEKIHDLCFQAVYSVEGE